LKANSNLNIIRLFGEMGAGADVVSGGELYRALQAGIKPEQIVFAGVGKTAAEIDYALEQGLGAFNVESESELKLIEKRAASLAKIAPVSLRVNPDVEAHTHHYITTGRQHNKFGLNMEHALELARYAAKSASLRFVGLQSHIGSQLLEVAPLAEAFGRLVELTEKLEEAGIAVEHLDLGGGIGVTYEDEQPEQPARLAAAIVEVLKEHGGLKKYKLMAEPGRYLTANAGLLLTNLLYLKQEAPDAPCFAIVDAGMNDLIRPALYSAKHRILTLHNPENAEARTYDVVGPVCESADFLGRSVKLPELQEGDSLALLSAGAYGFSMASNYNSRPRPPEILVDGASYQLIRRRESYADLVALES
jgi:diaminopimelate decarboxylase